MPGLGSTNIAVKNRVSQSAAATGAPLGPS